MWIGRRTCHDVSAAAKQFHVDVVPTAEARSCPPNRPNTLSGSDDADGTGIAFVDLFLAPEKEREFLATWLSFYSNPSLSDYAPDSGKL